MSILSNEYIDYVVLVVNATQSLTENIKTYLVYANFLNLSVITVFTHIDLVDIDMLEEMIINYKQLLKSLKLKKVPIMINSNEDVALLSRNIEENINPIFKISSKSGLGYDMLINFIYLLPVPQTLKLNKNLSVSQFDIHEYFLVDKMIIVGGIVSKGRMCKGDKYYLGPDKKGNFKYRLIILNI